MIYWLLYLFCGLIIAGCMIVFGRNLTQDPDSGFSASIAYKNKLLTAHPELNARVQKQYGNYLNKGGFGLAVIVIVGLFCVVSQSQDAIMIGGNIVLVIELLYALGLQIWMNQSVQKLTGTQPASSKRKKAARPSHSKAPAQSNQDQAGVHSALRQGVPASEPAPEMVSEKTPAPMQTSAADPTQVEEVLVQKENEPTTEAEWTEKSESAETEQAGTAQENETSIDSTSIDSTIVESSESPVFEAETATEWAGEENEDDDPVDPSMQALIQADIQTSVPEEDAPAEAELDEQARDEQIAQALRIANRTLAASMIQSASEQSATIAKRAAIEEKEEVSVEKDAPAEEGVREEIHTPGVKLVATKTSPLSSAPDPQRK